MITGYVLEGATGKRYVGITNNLQRRLIEYRKHQGLSASGGFANPSPSTSFHIDDRPPFGGNRQEDYQLVHDRGAARNRASAVDDVTDAAAGASAESDGDHMVHLDRGRRRRFNGVIGDHGSTMKRAIDTETPRFMSLHFVGDFIRRVSVGAVMAPRILIRRVVRHF
jgi:hypothetical protein